ncbi:MAG: four helix bundle protein [Planctomycetota bacterium]
MTRPFDHEKLDVYREAMRFVVWVHGALEKIPKRSSVYDQLERASTSIPLNIAEGNGKFTGSDRCRFFDMARGSALESAACLDVAAAKGQLSAPEAASGKEMLLHIVSMLVGLIKANSATRVHEGEAGYGDADGD